jgi:hypothetical protein
VTVLLHCYRFPFSDDVCYCAAVIAAALGFATWLVVCFWVLR